MDVLKIRGGKPLQGNICAAGAKNAMTKLLVASLLSDKKCTFYNVPNIGDVEITVTGDANSINAAVGSLKNELAQGPQSAEEDEYSVTHKYSFNNPLSPNQETEVQIEVTQE